MVFFRSSFAVIPVKTGRKQVRCGGELRVDWGGRSYYVEEQTLTAVLIPSSSGLLLESLDIETTATRKRLNPFFIRSAVGMMLSDEKISF